MNKKYIDNLTILLNIIKVKGYCKLIVTSCKRCPIFSNEKDLSTIACTPAYGGCSNRKVVLQHAIKLFKEYI